MTSQAHDREVANLRLQLATMTAAKNKAATALRAANYYVVNSPAPEAAKMHEKILKLLKELDDLHE